jgi:hypothetical protein
VLRRSGNETGERKRRKVKGKVRGRRGRERNKNGKKENDESKGLSVEEGRESYKGKDEEEVKRLKKGEKRRTLNRG